MITGNFDLTVKYRDITYCLNIKRKFTIIRGDSGTGKTALLHFVDSIKQQLALNSIECKYQVEIAPSLQTISFLMHDSKPQNKEEYKRLLHEVGIENKVLLIDENYHGITTDKFATFVQNADCYFIIITREKLPMLPYSMNEIYTLKQYKKTIRLQQVYDQQLDLANHYDCVITEDSNSGYDLFKIIYKNVIPAKGKSKIAKILEDKHKENSTQHFLVVLDAAAFGSEIETVLNTIKDNSINCDFFTPESFEWLICSSGIIQSDNINQAISDPYNTISVEFNSWEQFYTFLLKQETTNMQNTYSKSSLNKCYYKPCCFKKTNQFHCNIKQGVNKINSILGRFMIGKQQDMNLF